MSPVLPTISPELCRPLPHLPKRWILKLRFLRFFNKRCRICDRLFLTDVFCPENQVTEGFRIHSLFGTEKISE